MLKHKIRENIELKNLTTLKIGGAARFFVAAQTEEDVIDAVKFADENDVPVSKRRRIRAGNFGDDLVSQSFRPQI